MTYHATGLLAGECAVVVAACRALSQSVSQSVSQLLRCDCFVAWLTRTHSLTAGVFGVACVFGTCMAWRVPASRRLPCLISLSLIPSAQHRVIFFLPPSLRSSLGPLFVVRCALRCIVASWRRRVARRWLCHDDVCADICVCKASSSRSSTAC